MSAITVVGVVLSALLLLPSPSYAFDVHQKRNYANARTLPPSTRHLTPSFPRATFRPPLVTGLRPGATSLNREPPRAVLKLRVRSLQTVLFVGAVAVSYWSSAMVTDLASQVRLLAPAVGLLGLPHGAFDLALAGAITRKDRLLPFTLAYMGLASLVLGIWQVAPVGALGAFLAYSAYHFASDWNDQSIAWRIGGGLSAVGAPALFNAPEVARMFSMLSGHANISALVALARLAGVVGVLSIVWACRSRPALRPMVELATLFAAAAGLPVLLYFIAYFCFLHSPRHLCDVITEVSGRRRHALVQATTITIATLFGASLALFRLARISEICLNESTIRTVFTGLAVLTEPHMLLVERWDRRKKSAGVPALP